MQLRHLALAVATVLSPAHALAATAATDLDEVIVTATRTEIALGDSLVPAQVIDRAEIERSQAVTLPDLLRGRAGINLVNAGGIGKQSSLFMRGAGSNQILVLLDGVRIGSATAGLPALQDIPVAQIDRIEIVRGPHSSLYGADAIGGVIQIFTRRDTGAARPRLHAGIGSNALREAGAGIGGGGARAWFGADVALLRTDGINACRGTLAGFGAGCYAEEPDRDGYRNLSGSLRGGLALSEAWSIDGVVLRAEAENEYDGTWANYSETVQQVVGARLRYVPTGTLAVQAGIGRSDDQTEDYLDGAFVAELRTRREQASAQAEVTLAAEQVLTLGVDWLDDRIAGSTGYDLTSRDNLGVFAAWRGGFGAQQWQASLRSDDNEQFGSHATGSLGWGLALARDLRLTASYATGFRAPSFNDLYFPFSGNPNLDPEESKNLNLGLAQARDGWSWSLDLYRNRVDDLINYDSTTFRPVNVDRARLRGAELTLAATLSGWALSAQLSHVDPRNLSDGSNHGRLLARRARNTGRLDLDRGFGPLRAGVTLNAAGHRYDDAANTVRVGGHATTDLRLEYALHPDWTLQARVANVFDREYETIAWYHQPGREYRLALRWQPGS